VPKRTTTVLISRTVLKVYRGMRMRPEPGLDTNMAFGIVIRAPLEVIERIRQSIAKEPEAMIVYNRISTERLWIVKDRGDSGE
jgi:hypothetical protein